MKKSKKCLVFFSCLLGLTFNGAYAHEQGQQNDVQPMTGWHKDNHWHGGFFHQLHQLDLSESQDEKIFQIIHDQETQLYHNRQIIREDRKKVMQLSKGSYDQTDMANLSNQIATAMASNIMIHAQIRHDIYQILTPEQRTQLDNMPRPHDRWAHRGQEGLCGEK